MIFTRGNAAKQWIAERLSVAFHGRPHRILDLGCGSGEIWEAYVKAEPGAHILGVDYDVQVIERGKKRFAATPSVELRVFDAQRPLEEGEFDVVVALSAIEHVVDRPAFLQTVWKALKPGGIAYLNYDAGHFRSRNLKERLMVPVSQLLAWAGMEGPYMKKVDDALFRSQAEKIGFRVEGLRKHNISPLKGFMRGANEEQVKAWYEFEEKMGTLYAPEALDPIAWSSTLVLRKP
jgi:ubiquinone/menaquinone biosynthesis C-methylase UbiE